MTAKNPNNTTRIVVSIVVITDKLHKLQLIVFNILLIT
jgi:hypothetical protein